MQELWESLSGWIVRNGANFAVDLVTALIILIASKILIGIICRITRQSMERTGKFSDMMQDLAINVLEKALWLFAWVIALGQLGIAIGPMIAGLGIVGFVVGFAFQDTLGNFAAGFMIALNEPFEKGNYVEVAGLAGVVSELNLMATTLNTPDNRRVTIPNGKVWGEPIINYTANETRRVDMTIGISYSSDIDKAQRVVREVLEANEKVLKEPAPTIEVVEMADSSVNLVVRPWSKTPDYWGVFFATQKAIKQAFDREGIEIPFPQRVIHQAPPDD